MKNVWSMTIIATLALSGPAFAQDYVTITPNPAPSGQAQGPAPFTYRGNTGSRTQQVYLSDFFAGAQTITSLAFRSTPGFRNAADYANVIVMLSTTSFGDESETPLSATFADNIGVDATQVYQGALSFAAPSSDNFEYVVNFSNGFFYDPSRGNLLLDVLIPVGTSVSGPGFFLASYDTANQVDDGVFSVNSVFDGEATSGIANTAGTITRFVGTPSTGTVPEPATWSLMILGFGAIGGSLRRRASRVSFAL